MALPRGVLERFFGNELRQALAATAPVSERPRRVLRVVQGDEE